MRFPPGRTQIPDCRKLIKKSPGGRGPKEPRGPEDPLLSDWCPALAWLVSSYLQHRGLGGSTFLQPVFTLSPRRPTACLQPGCCHLHPQEPFLLQAAPLLRISVAPVGQARPDSPTPRTPAPNSGHQLSSVGSLASVRFRDPLDHLTASFIPHKPLERKFLTSCLAGGGTHHHPAAFLPFSVGWRVFGGRGMAILVY